MDLPFHCDNDVGYLNARIEEIEKIDVLFSSQTLSIGTSVLGLIFTIAMLWNISSEITLLFACPIPLLVLASFYFSKKITKQVRNTLDHTAEYSGKMQEALQGIETIKSQGTEKEEGKKIDFYNRKALDSQRQQSYSMNKFSTGISSVGNIIKAIVYLIGGIFYIRGKITMGAFIAISAYVSKLYSPILYFAGMSIALQPAVTAMKRVSEFFFGEQKEDDDKHQKLSEIRDIKFKKVCFSYNIDEPLLNDINITIKRGDRIQLEGKNGSGKSTLIRLLIKVLTPTSGAITINGINLQAIKKRDILDTVAYIPQRNFLFNESIEYNVFYGLNDYSYERYEYLMNGLDLFSVAKRIERENKGKVGENGAKLSGGEIKKICIARALLKKHSVIIFDEAMSNIDARSMHFILSELNRSDAIMIVIDHSNNLEKYGFKKICLA